MGCPAECQIDNNLTFSICTHDPETGVLTDADSAPIYRIYEDEVGAAIATGTMSKLDNDNTTGFYAETVAVTAVIGYESGKTYTIYIEATVDGDTGGISLSFKATDWNDIMISDITGVEVDNDGTAISLEGALKLLLSALTAESSGGGTTNVKFRDLADSKNRIDATVDADGNRTVVTRDAS